MPRFAPKPKAQSLLFLCLLLILSGGQARGEEDGPLVLNVMETLSVYSRPNSSSTVLIQLDIGDEVPISKKEKNGFRLIRVLVADDYKNGYLKAADLQLSYIRGRDAQKAKTRPENPYRSHNGAGVYFAYSRLNQGSWSFTTSDTVSTYTIDKMVSTGFYPGFFIDHPATENLSFKFYLSLRKNTFEGQARLNSTSNDTKISQSLLGGGLTAKYYLNPHGSFWLGGGTELARGTDVSITISGQPAEVPDEIQPVYWFFYVTSGYEYDLKGWCYLLPEIRAGLAVNTDPMVVDLELILGIGWAL